MSIRLNLSTTSTHPGRLRIGLLHQRRRRAERRLGSEIRIEQSIFQNLRDKTMLAFR
jgi:hypothetical protein